MPKGARVFSLFLAGANDVADENAVIRQLVDEWNRHHGSRLGAFVTVTSWKTHAYPATGSEPQAVINRQVLDAADIVVGSFWTRFGTPTSSANSGTEEEIERSIAAGKRVMVYFSDRPIAPSHFDAAQYARVVAFKEKYSSRGLYSTYGDVDTFRDHFRTHLALLMNELCDALTQTAAPPIEHSGEAVISISLAPEYWIVILGAMDHAVQIAMRAADDLRRRGVTLEEVSPADTTAIAGPLLVRTFIIDVLVKHGVMTKEAGEKLGYSSLIRAVNEASDQP